MKTTEMAVKLGALQGAAQIVTEFLEGSTSWTQDVMLSMMRDALDHDGSEDYWERKHIERTQRRTR